MRRREFIAGTVATAALSFARRACAQTNARTPVTKCIAIVHVAEKVEDMTVNGRRSFKAYFWELNRLGYIEGRNLVVERYSARGRPDRYGDLARTVVASQPDLIVALGGSLALQFKPLTAIIPILASTADPVAVGLVTNLARPGGNITGVSADTGLELWGKRLQFLSEAVSKQLTNVRYFAASSTKWWDEARAEMGKSAQQAGIRLVAATLPLSDFDNAAYERAFDTMAKDGVDGLLVSDAGEHITNRQLIVDLAAKHRLPAIYAFREFVEVGGLLSYGVDLADIMRRLADITDQVLRGAKPGDIPFYQQTKFELVLNRKAARSLGLEFPPTLLTAANEVIE
jgi:putative tryptophan/tyrosine transport system substrate-binding protein